MYQKYTKRILDIIFSAILFPFVVLIVCFFGMLIVIDDGFPIFYNAERRGKNGRMFSMYKLRSMKKNSPDIRKQDGSTYNSESDPRLTKIGKFIRRYSIDEIPQIFNVLIGNMSFVGPRPGLASKKYADLEEKKKKRLEVMPGITGYSQAYYRNSISQEEKIDKDCWYVENVSFLLDAKIVIKTFIGVIRHANIYNTKDN